MEQTVSPPNPATSTQVAASPKMDSDTLDASYRFLRLKDVMKIVGLSRSSIYEKIKKGEFPKPVPLGARAVAWISTEIAYWLQMRIDVREKSSKPVHG